MLLHIWWNASLAACLFRWPLTVSAMGIRWSEVRRDAGVVLPADVTSDVAVGSGDCTTGVKMDDWFPVLLSLQPNRWFCSSPKNRKVMSSNTFRWFHLLVCELETHLQHIATYIWHLSRRCSQCRTSFYVRIRYSRQSRYAEKNHCWEKFFLWTHDTFRNHVIWYLQKARHRPLLRVSRGAIISGWGVAEPHGFRETAQKWHEGFPCVFIHALLNGIDVCCTPVPAVRRTASIRGITSKTRSILKSQRWGNDS